MPLVDLKTPPSKSMQRWFGVSLAALIALLGYLLGHFGNAVSIVLWLLAAVVGCVYYAFPKSQLPIIRLWQYITFPIAWLLGHVLLGVAFFGVFLPIGLMLRLVGYDPLRLRKNPSSSEWIPREKTKDVSRYFKQF